MPERDQTPDPHDLIDGPRDIISDFRRATQEQVRQNVGELAWQAAHPDRPTGRPPELELFEYHSPTSAQIDAITQVRIAMKAAAMVILTVVPASAERTLSLRALHLASMQANAAIVFDGRKIV